MPRIVMAGNEPGKWSMSVEEIIVLHCPWCETPTPVGEVTRGGYVLHRFDCSNEGCSYREWLLLDGYS